MKYTPGPWWWDEHTECIGSPAGWICDLTHHGERKSDVEFGPRHCDAHLIAAAPDLLATCKLTKRFLDATRLESGIGNVLLPFEKAAFEQIDAALTAAIAKAQGKAQ